MQKGKRLHFDCISCMEPVYFSIFDLNDLNPSVYCSHCKKQYDFDDATLIRQLRKFEALCSQILDSEEILGETSVGIDIGPHHVQIPYKLLLTRFNSNLNLEIGEEVFSITFRFEPSVDFHNNLIHSSEEIK